MSASNMRAIKNRMKSIRSTRQITKAMELVASSKMRKAMARTEKSKPYFSILTETLNDIASSNRDFSSVFTQRRGGRMCRIVIAGDRGLAGGYNHNLFKSLELGKDDIIFPIGKKAAEYFSNSEIYTTDYERAGDIEMEHCREIGKLIAEGYRRGDFTGVTLSYTSYRNMLIQLPKTVDILPLRIDTAEKGEKRRSMTIYEPSAEGVFDRIVPNFIAGMVYGAVSESVTSELSARRTAMEAATDNAEQMLDKLELEYNRARQANITRELTEIIAGAENL